MRIQHEKLMQQNEILPYLALALPKNSHVYEFAKVGGRPQCPKCGTTVGRLAGGTPPGWPDLLVLVPGHRPIALELKWGNNLLDDDQKRVHAELNRGGWGVWTCWSLGNVQSALRTEAVTLRLVVPEINAVDAEKGA